jgi:shikimate kinase
MKNFHTFTDMRIYLIGYMASGKSNLGWHLAEKLGYRFIDLDYLFEERYRISVLDFFEKYDEVAFRKLEQALLHETTVLEDVVVSTGGGTPCFFDNMQVIRQAGISVYLYWEIPALVSRLKMVKRKRPLLKDVPVRELEQKVSVQLNQRAFYYNQADLVVNGADFDADKLLPMIKGLQKEG